MAQKVVWSCPSVGTFSLFRSSSSSSLSATFPPLLRASSSSSSSSSFLCCIGGKQKHSSDIWAINPGFYEIPTYEGIPVGSTLKLYNLPYNVDRQAVIHHFNSCGADVKSLEITNNEEEGNAHGVITLGDPGQACVAVAQLDGDRLQGKCLRMDFIIKRPYDTQHSWKSYLSRPDSSFISSPNSFRRSSSNRIYVGNLHWRVDVASLQQLFAAHGTVQEAQIVKDPLNGRSRGFGFVVMSTAAEREKAVAALDGCEVERRQLKVSVASRGRY